MRFITILILSLFALGALAGPPGMNKYKGGYSSVNGGSFNLDIRNVTGAGSGGDTSAGVGGRLNQKGPGVSRIGSAAIGGTTFNSTSRIPCSDCNNAATTKTNGLSGAAGGAASNLSKNATGYAEYGADAGSGGYSEVDRTFALSIEKYGKYKSYGKYKRTSGPGKPPQGGGRP